MITMSQKELHRLEVIQKIRDRRLSVVQAAELLGLSRLHSCTIDAAETFGRARLAARPYWQQRLTIPGTAALPAVPGTPADWSACSLVGQQVERFIVAICGWMP
ncbi:hypothetical protein LZK75_35590 (plasmid) [Rhizobium leguminosarum]|nr:hypothetical protein LZK75_35590 [Rhizobium leguminosarum]